MIESTLDEELMKIVFDEEKLFLTVLTYIKVDSEDYDFLLLNLGREWDLVKEECINSILKKRQI